MPMTFVGGLRNAEAVSLSDTAEFKEPSVGLWVGGAGNVVVTMWDGNDQTFNAVAAGTFLPIAVKKVKVATTATLIVRLF